LKKFFHIIRGRTSYNSVDNAIDMVFGFDIMGLQVASALPPQGGEQKMALKAGL